MCRIGTWEEGLFFEGVGRRFNFSFILIILFWLTPTHPPMWILIYLFTLHFTFLVMLYFLLTKLPSTSWYKCNTITPLFFLLMSTTHLNFFFFNLTMPSVLLKFLASSLDLLLHFFFSFQIPRISDRNTNFTNLRLNQLMIWIIFQVRPQFNQFSHFFLYAQFSYIKNHFHEWFMVNPVRPYSSVWV